MSSDVKGREPISHQTTFVTGSPLAAPPGDPLGWLPRFSSGQLRLERLLADWSPDGRLPVPLRWFEEWASTAISIDRPEILWRASGLRRIHLTVQLSATRLGTRLGIGIEIPVAHAVVDHLLGLDRPLAASRLQLTPVEWGVWSFLVLHVLDTLNPEAGEARAAGPLATADLTVDRVGPDPFDSDGIGGIVTIRWPVRVGTTAGAVRMWVGEQVVEGWLAARSRPAQATRAVLPDPARAGRLESTWRAVAGAIPLPHGLKRLRVGGILPLSNLPVSGTPSSPSGPVDLVLDLHGQGGQYRIATHTVENSAGRLLRAQGPLSIEPSPRDSADVFIQEAPSMSQSNPPAPAPGVSPLDVPVTLTVELGRVNLTLTQLADIKAGDVIELNRHSRAPVELTSSGRLVARGELILIDTDLGVRVTGVFL